ncbi:hypothetical protein [Spiroplasma alleghenense]|uniref:Transmembrane protein n=1 Tax=Spiroplasma alleghenense TaxID=216931 RepID=A0A345Z3F2_9MOLU|nr:hypothetical protein [Spiroplasma alleghenense]AXK51131.1 hypothetical protein SALLE_v1c04570 [Spiroplasma alleghenense]
MKKNKSLFSQRLTTFYVSVGLFYVFINSIEMFKFAPFFDFGENLTTAIRIVYAILTMIIGVYLIVHLSKIIKNFQNFKKFKISFNSVDRVVFISTSFWIFSIFIQIYFFTKNIIPYSNTEIAVIAENVSLTMKNFYIATFTISLMLYCAIIGLAIAYRFKMGKTVFEETDLDSFNFFLYEIIIFNSQLLNLKLFKISFNLKNNVNKNLVEKLEINTKIRKYLLLVERKKSTTPPDEIVITK